MVKQRGKNGSVDIYLVYAVMLLLDVGIIMVYSASSYVDMINHNGNSAYTFTRQLIFATLGCIAMYIMSRYDYHRLKNKRLVFILMIITVILLFAVFLFPGVNGAKRWIMLGPLSFQPSELAKYVVVIYLAMALTNNMKNITSFWKGIVPALMMGGIFAAIILSQKNLSIASVTLIVTFIMLFVAGGRKKHLFGIVAPAMLCAATTFTLIEPYRKARLLNFINPWKDAAGNGYQLIQSFYALGAGGLTGLGLGQSRQKTLYMPEPHNDFIFAIIGEELGLVGCVVIIALFIFFIITGIRIAMRAKDNYGTLLAIGITSIIAIQAIINIAVVTGSMPVTGVPLPFISYGGSSLVVNLMAMGILMNISRQIDKKPKKGAI